MPPKKKVLKKKKKKVNVLPPIPSSMPNLFPTPKEQSLLFTVSGSDIKGLATMVTHYGYGNTLQATDINGSNSIHLAAKKGDFRMLKHLLSYPETCSGINACEKPLVGGYAPIHHACSIGSSECLELLLEVGADPSLICNSNLGETALHLCCKLGRINCGRILMEYGARTDASDAFGHNPSFWAFTKHHEGMVAALGLPPSRVATAEEYLKIMKGRNATFVLPFMKSKTAKKEKGGKKKK